ncbi:MAG: ABC-F family ATP-binding cassette domain-containing protein [Phycisphaerales bacterium]
MPLVTASNLRVTLGAKQVLDGATFGLEPGERVGLVGRNGCGKTTLLKILCNTAKMDSGDVSLQRGVRLGYMAQEHRFDVGDTMRTAASKAMAEADQAKIALDAVFEAMATAEGDELQRLLDRQVELEEAIERGGGWSSDHLVDAVLHGLGFVDEQFDIPVTGLSGGQKARLSLARLLLQNPDVILLDEPTNHLDIDGCKWLENFLAETFKGAVVVISHDRRLLDRVVHRIEEIHDGRVRSYPGNYEAFVALRAERHLTQMRVHEKQLDKIRSEERYIMRYKAGQRAKQARGRATRLERFKRDELVERPIELDSMRISLPSGPRVGDSVLVAEGISKKLGDRQLFSNLDLFIAPGDRIGIIGPNGTGKTTLVRTLLGELEPDTGTIKRSPKMHAGWFRQTHEHLDRTLNIWQHLQRTVPARPGGSKLTEQEARNLAGAFLFSGIEQEKALGELSGGERARAVIAGLVAGGHNLLVLDEPTNHLDIPSAERLEEALAMDPDDGGFDGALLLVSHDRALLAATCDRLIVMDGHGNASLFDGTYDEWEAKRAADARAAAAPKESQRRAPTPAPAAKPSPKPAEPKGKRSPLDNKSAEELESAIARMNARKTAIDEDLVSPALARDRAKLDRLLKEREQLEKDLAGHEEAWLRKADASA